MAVVTYISERRTSPPHESSGSRGKKLLDLSVGVGQMSNVEDLSGTHLENNAPDAGHPNHVLVDLELGGTLDWP